MTPTYPPLKMRPRWQRPFIKLLNWLQYGHTERKFGNHVVPGYGVPRCSACGEPISGHFHVDEASGEYISDTGDILPRNQNPARRS